MVRIIIEIDGKEVTTATLLPSPTVTGLPQIVTNYADAQVSAAPPELLAAAAALGAMSAGPAPSESFLRTSEQVSPSTSAMPDSTDAGPAPNN